MDQGEEISNSELRNLRYEMWEGIGQEGVISNFELRISNLKKHRAGEMRQGVDELRGAILLVGMVHATSGAGVAGFRSMLTDVRRMKCLSYPRERFTEESRQT